MSAARIGNDAVKAVPELTDWYCGDQRPERDGVYERQIQGLDNPSYSYWSGSVWGHFEPTIDRAFKERCSVSGFQESPWRGLASDPAGGAK